MKSFSITWIYSITEEVVVDARDKKEALKKFKQIHPDDRITDIYELDRRLAEI